MESGFAALVQNFPILPSSSGAEQLGIMVRVIGGEDLAVNSRQRERVTIRDITLALAILSCSGASTAPQNTTLPQMIVVVGGDVVGNGAGPGMLASGGGYAGIGRVIGRGVAMTGAAATPQRPRHSYYRHHVVNRSY
jgi:hypothetical protein